MHTPEYWSRQAALAWAAATRSEGCPEFQLAWVRVAVGFEKLAESYDPAPGRSDARMDRLED